MAKTDAELRIDLSKLRATMEQKLGRLVKDPAARALRSVGEVWMTEAKRRTPVDTGVLRSTGHVQGPTFVANDWQVKLVFGGPSAQYAATVHENLNMRHTIGQAKYLESVTAERGPNLSREVAAFMLGGAKVYGQIFGKKK